jgi:acyl-[acyl-carrier-protein]-phospholipid O-acyltransferase/long-chain-fatty-acid--[acyl-carrier-protein] ligase
MIAFLRFLVRLLYRYRIYNPEVLKVPGPVLLLPNHTSWWDWLLIGVCLDEDWRFVTSAESAETSWIHKKIMVNRRTFPVDINSAYAVKHMAEYLQKGGRLVLFPEGRLSRTGALMKLFDGTGFLIFKTHAKVITAYVRGAYRLPFSPNTAAKRWWPRLSVHFSELLSPPEMRQISVTEARHRLTDWLLDKMIRQQFETEMQFGPATIPGAILEAARQQPGKIIFQDATMQKVTYRRLVVAASLLANQWQKRLESRQARIGLLLPNVNAFPVVTLSLWFANKTPTILNYTSGVPVVLTCAQLAGLNQVITSRAFLEHLKLDLQPLRAAGIELLFLEDIRASIPTSTKFWTALLSRLNLQPPTFNPDSRSEGTPSDAPSSVTAVILFTSGSEGIPKGVELTHDNLLANIRQMLSVIDLWESDRFFNALPLFHSFGLTVGLLLPLIQRVFVFLYVSPLHYRVVPSAFYNLDCSVLFGTNTFLSGYARKAQSYDFRTLRYVFAGAEKLQEHTSTVWARKFGARVLEGYGVTECSPCLTANTPQRHKFGSAGQFLPDIDHRLEKVEGINEADAGRLFVRGPNIMRGYLNPEANEKFKSLGGWYDTGDIAKVDPEGYLFILGRLKRFAKISGEMVSLAAIEDALADAFPEYGLKFAVAVAAKKDDAKGEKLVLVTNELRLTIEQAREAIRRRGLGNLAVPREIKVLHDIPRLGTGKVNHRELEKLV